MRYTNAPVYGSMKALSSRSHTDTMMLTDRTKTMNCPRDSNTSTTDVRTSRRDKLKTTS